MEMTLEIASHQYFMTIAEYFKHLFWNMCYVLNSCPNLYNFIAILILATATVVGKLWGKQWEDEWRWRCLEPWSDYPLGRVETSLILHVFPMICI